MEITNNRLDTQMISGTNKILRHKYEPYNMRYAIKQIYIIAKRYCENFKLSNYEENVYKQFIMWLHGDENFDGDLKKGIAVVGPTGTGKSLMFKIMEDYRMIDDIHYIFAETNRQLSWGLAVVPDNLNLAYASQGEEGLRLYKYQNILYLDDLGTEVGSAKHFGNELDVVNHVLFHRHRLGKLTLMSSNIPKAMMKDKYGDRVGSRMNEMFNFLTLKTDDKRL